MGSSAKSVDEVVEEIMAIHRSLPERPGIDEVEAAKTLIQNVEKEDQARLEAIARQKKSKNVPEEMFMVLQEMQKNMVHFQSKEQKKEALRLIELEHIHELFDDLIQRASKCVSGGGGGGGGGVSSNFTSNHQSYSTPSSDSSSLSLTNSTGGGGGGGSLNSLATATISASSLYFEKEPSKTTNMFAAKDDSFVKKSKASASASLFGDGIGGGLRSREAFTPQIVDSSLKTSTTSGQDAEKLSLIKLASLIEVSSKKGTRDLNLRSKLQDQIEWLPDSIGKLSGLLTLDLSENRLLVLPTTIGGLSSLTKLNLHSNRLSQLPDSMGDLLNLVCLDISSNQLTSLPGATLGRLIRLEELNVSSNNLSSLPEAVGSLVSLKILDVETNDIDEIPHTIGQCSSLRELRADYNRIKALPEAVGKISTLEVLSVRYNNIRQLPTTMSSLSHLKELNVSFNELESVPESLCFATTLVKMNVSNNFADLRALPRSIGNLEMLEELDISNNQIRTLPDSFRMLSQLRVLKVEGNPLEVPPKNVIEMGAQAVVQYMAEHVAKRDVKSVPVKQKKSWVQICFFSKSNKRKRNGMDYVQP